MQLSLPLPHSFTLVPSHSACAFLNVLPAVNSLPAPTPTPATSPAPAVTLSTLLEAALHGFSSRSDNVHVGFLFLLLVLFFHLFFCLFFFCNLLLKPKLRGSAAFRVIKKCGQHCQASCCPRLWATGRPSGHSLHFTALSDEGVEAAGSGEQGAEAASKQRATAFAVVHFC